MADKFAALSKNMGDRLAEPEVIAKLILKATSATKPKTRYVAGFMAKPILFLRKILPDRMMDKLFLSQVQ